MLKALLLVPVLLALICCASGCGESADSAEQGDKEPQPVPVNVLAATATSMERTTTQPATVHADFEAKIFAKAAGYLSELRVDIGTTVSEGQVLAVIGIPEMSKQREGKLATIRRLEAEERRFHSQLAVARASVDSFGAKRDQAQAESAASEASLAAALVEMNRASELVEQRAVADRLLDEARKKHDAAEAIRSAAQAAVLSADAELQLAIAQKAAAEADVEVAHALTDVAHRELEELDELMKYARLTAPFDGVVTERNVNPGDLVRNTQTGSGWDGPALFVVTKLDRVRIRVPVPERDAPFATPGDAAKITLQALPGQTFEGQVSRVAGVLDERTRTMLVEIDLPNPAGQLRPGMFGQATIVLAPPSDTLTLPARAVRFDEQGNGYVYIVDAAEQVAIAEVETGLDSGQHIEIVAGLQGDERVIGPMLRRLKAGQPVTVN